jgi:hypothetical protein
MKIRLFTFFLSAAVASLALAQAPVRIRGTVESLQGNTLKVKSRGGESLTVHLADNAMIVGIAKAGLADLQSGRYVGSTTVGERDGAMVALEVHIFPESMRGTGEGHRDFDARPNSKMTNAAVADIKSVGADRVMTVSYKGGEKKILVTSDTVVVSYQPADRSHVKPGAGLYINAAEKKPDGTFSASRINVGLDGQAPPF